MEGDEWKLLDTIEGILSSVRELHAGKRRLRTCANTVECRDGERKRTSGATEEERTRENNADGPERSAPSQLITPPPHQRPFLSRRCLFERGSRRNE